MTSIKFEEYDNVCVVNEPLQVWDIIKKKIGNEMQDEPIYICNLSDVVRKHKIWKQLLPRVIPFYAVKCNDSPLILKTLASLGTGFDCASRGEIQKVLEIGVPSNRIIFANPTKPKSHVGYARKMNVNVMTVDSDIEMYKIEKNFPDSNLVLRIRCDAKKAQCPLGEKFGCNVETEANNLITLGKTLNLKIIGISFHVGSGCMDLPVYNRAIKESRKLFDYAKMLGYNFYLLDIGGGFPGDNNTNLNDVAAIINKSIDKYFPASENVTIVAEPGRFYVSSAYTLICKIHSKKQIKKNGTIENMYYINDGVYGSFNCNLYDHQIVVPKISKDLQSNESFTSSIWGPTCDALDKVCDSVLLPNLDIDDIIIFENMGAYTIPIASPFNGFPLPRVEYYLEMECCKDINDNLTIYEYIFNGYNRKVVTF